jgi:hypothetical protein
MSIGNELFHTVNRWLGWGDPENGLWFIGMEEGAAFDESVATRRGKVFEPVSGGHRLDWPVATTTAKVVSRLLGLGDHTAYRDTMLWRKGSRVFNGNLLPLGRPRRASWPDQYERLFEVRYAAYAAYFGTAEEERFNQFREFRQKMKPQAVVCFGKGFWSHFERVFVANPDDRRFGENGTVVFETDRVILTGHFSYGRWMPNKAVTFVANTLSRWRVSLPIPASSSPSAT